MQAVTESQAPKSVNSNQLAQLDDVKGTVFSFLLHLTSMEEQKVVVKFYTLLQKENSEIHSDLVKAFSDDALSLRTVQKWAKLFREGRASTADDPRSGRPVTATTEDNVIKVKHLIDEDPKITKKALMVEVGVSIGSIEEILHNKLNMTKLSCRWVPRLLTSMQRETRRELCNLFINKFDTDTDKFMQSIITGDETWLYAYDPASKESSKEWREKGSSPPIKPMAQKSVRSKVMAAVFFDPEGVIHIEYLERGKFVNSQRYIEALANLRNSIRRRRRGKLSSGILLHHDNAPAHRSAATRQVISQHGFEVLPHPPFSPDLAPCDLYLFPQIKKMIKGHRFEGIDELKQAFEAALFSKSPEFFREAFFKWRYRAEKCVEHNGDYIEK